MSTFDQVKSVLGEVLQLGARTEKLHPDTPLFGSIPELDSMAVVNVIVGLEERFDITVEDNEITADVFSTVGSLADFVDQKAAE